MHAFFWNAFCAWTPRAADTRGPGGSWREFGSWLGEPTSAVDKAYANATQLAPDETRFLTEWGRFTERGSLALLEWQGRQLAELQVPEHLDGPGVLGEPEFAKQSATMDALRRSADELKHALSVAIEKRDPHLRHLMEDLDAARRRLEGPEGERVDKGLEVARDLTQAFLAGAGRQTAASE